MSAIKFFTTLLFFASAVSYGQRYIYPKDTIYILFDKEKHIKKLLNHPELGKNLYFENIGVNYNYNQKADTLCTLYLKDYKFSNLKEINSKEWRWYKKNLGGPPPISNKNWVFVTYLIEVISKDYFVIYPVNWPGEGVID